MKTVKRMTLVAYMDRYDQADNVMVTITPRQGDAVTSPDARVYATANMEDPEGLEAIECDDNALQGEVVEIMRQIAGKLSSMTVRKSE